MDREIGKENRERGGKRGRNMEVKRNRQRQRTGHAKTKTEEGK